MNENLIPPQYKDLPSEVVEELWQIPVYNDNEKTKSENVRKETALAELRKRERKSLAEDHKKANEIRVEIGIPIQTNQDSTNETVAANAGEGITTEDFAKFRIKNGETDTGVFWNELSNAAAKKLKEAGKFEWGKERLYFEIPLSEMENLRDIAMDVAKTENIPIAFKYLDVTKTNAIDLAQGSDTTRFVANFASTKDAKKFYDALSKRSEYTNIKPDRKIDYHGHDLDGKANYASGFREKREPLKRIVETAKQNPDNTYTYPSADGSKQITITEKQYQNFVAQYNSMPDPKTSWDNIK